MQQRVLLVVPCYNEAARLPIDLLRAAPDWLSFVLVDDGSRDGTANVIRNRMDGRMRLLALPKNVGKAEAVRQGMLDALGHDGGRNFDWFGYWDADLATPLFEVQNMMTYREAFSPDSVAVFGSRVLRFGARIRRHHSRHVFGRIFATVMQKCFGVGSYDSQCGAKLFRPDTARSCFTEPFVTKWSFDVEIILRMKNAGIVEYPLMQWEDVPGGKISFWKDSFSVLGDILRLKARYR